MSYEVEEVSFSEIDKRRFFLMCSLYSFVDAVIFHPPTVAAVVAELHRVPLAQDKSASFLARFRRSFGANLSVMQAAQHIIKSSNTKGKFAIVRALYTGFPITFTGLFIYDLAQMLPYNFAKTKLASILTPVTTTPVTTTPVTTTPVTTTQETTTPVTTTQETTTPVTTTQETISSSIPIPMLAGLMTNLVCAPVSNIPWVLFRQQIQQRCVGQPHSLGYVLSERLPKMEGGAFRVLFRGIFVSLATGVPAAALGWQVYESTKEKFQRDFESKSVWTSIAAGCVSGGVGVVATRPIGVVVARMQTDTQALGFFRTAKTIYKAEGPGAFYKGLLARLLSSAPRSGLFFGVYQSLITWSRVTPRSDANLIS